MPHGNRIAELLINIGAIKLSIDPPFTWASGIKSPIYCDNRMLYGHPDARDFVVDALVHRVRTLHIEPDVIAGTATAAIGWAALVADRMKLPLVYVRSAAKGHGMQKRIEGDKIEDKHVVLIEDLFSTGGSAISSVQALREEGKAVVTDVVSIMSYEMHTCIEKAEENSVRLHPVCTFGKVLEVATEQGRLTAEDFTKIAGFSENPADWGKNL